MTEYREGGRRRIDRVLAPGFLEGVEQLGVEELRSRRDDAEQEEADLSYARRLLQGRLDLLHVEQQRRASGVDAPAPGQRDDMTLARDLAKALAAESERQVTGLGRHLTHEPSRIGEHRRAAEAAVADLRAAVPAELSDDELAAAVSRLTELEQRASGDRHAVQRVVDALAVELADRLTAGAPEHRG